MVRQSVPGSGCIRRSAPATVSAARLAEYAHRSPRTCIVSPGSSATDTGGSQSSGGGGGAGAAWAAPPPLLLAASPALHRTVSGTGGRASNGADCCQLAAAAGADGVNLGSGLGPAEDFSFGKRSDVPKQPRVDLDDGNELRRSPSPSRFISDSAEGTDFPSLSMWLWLISATKSLCPSRRRRGTLGAGVLSVPRCSG